MTTSFFTGFTPCSTTSRVCGRSVTSMRKGSANVAWPGSPKKPYSALISSQTTGSASANVRATSRHSSGSPASRRRIEQNAALPRSPSSKRNQHQRQKRFANDTSKRLGFCTPPKIKHCYIHSTTPECSFKRRISYHSPSACAIRNVPGRTLPGDANGDAFSWSKRTPGNQRNMGFCLIPKFLCDMFAHQTNIVYSVLNSISMTLPSTFSPSE